MFPTVFKKIAGFIRDLVVITLITCLLLEAVLQVLSLFVDKNTREGDAGGARYKIVVVGDSNSWGLFVEADQAWPAVLQKKFTESGYSVNVINTAYPGTNSTRIAKNIPAILTAYQPDVIVFMAGINDYWTKTIYTHTWYGKLNDWLQAHLRIYKAWLIFDSNISFNKKNQAFFEKRFVEERKNLDDDQLVSKFLENDGAYINRHKDIVMGGAVIQIGTDTSDPSTKSAAAALHRDYKSTIHYSITSIVHDIQGTPTRLVVATYPAWGGWSGNINALMREQASAHKLLLVDNELSGPHCSKSEYLLTDCHPNPRGHQLIAGNVFKAVAPLFTKEP